MFKKYKKIQFDSIIHVFVCGCKIQYIVIYSVNLPLQADTITKGSLRVYLDCGRREKKRRGVK